MGDCDSQDVSGACDNGYYCISAKTFLPQAKQTQAFQMSCETTYRAVNSKF